jgi:hypothetical protein
VHLQLPSRRGFQRADGRGEVTREEVVPAPRGSVSVVDAGYLGRVFNASTIGFSRSSLHAQYPAKNS